MVVSHNGINLCAPNVMPQDTNCYIRSDELSLVANSRIYKTQNNNHMRAFNQSDLNINSGLFPIDAIEKRILSYLNLNDLQAVSAVNKQLKKQIQKGDFLFEKHEIRSQRDQFIKNTTQSLDEKRKAITEMLDNCLKGDDLLFANKLPWVKDPFFQQVEESLSPENIQKMYLYAPDDAQKQYPLGINANEHPFLYFKVDRKEYIQNLKSYIKDLQKLINENKDTSGMYMGCKINAEEVLAFQRKQKVITPKQWVRFIPANHSKGGGLYQKYDQLLSKGVLKATKNSFDFHNKRLPLYSDLNGHSPVSLRLDKSQLISLYKKLLCNIDQSKQTLLTCAKRGETIEA